MGRKKPNFKQVMLHIEIYNYLQAQKRGNESFNDVLRRILFKKKYEEIDEIKPKYDVDEIKPIIDDEEVDVDVAREED
jgi:predicted CopG family antitoxin